MAQQVKVLLIDDLDGGEAAETVRFGLDGKDYEIDLSDAHANELREVLARFAAQGRKLSKVSGAAYHRTTVPTKRDNRAIREWAQANGHELSDRGRIPDNIIEAYDARDRKAPESPTSEVPKVEFSGEDSQEAPKKRVRRKATADA